MDKDLEIILTRNYKESMIQFIKDNPHKIDDLIRIIFERDNPFSWRAAWILWSCIDPDDTRLKKNIINFIEILPNSNESLQRELLKILYTLELGEDNLGILFNACINIWEDINKRSGVRFNAFRLINKIAERFPELKNEIEYLLDERYINTLSPGIKNSIKKFRYKK